MPKENKKDAAYQIIKQGILSGEFRSGEIYNLNELSDQINISNTPTREALLVLEHEGLIEPIPRTGYMVTPITMTDVLEMFQLRRLLEGEAIRLAVANMNAEIIRSLELNNKAERDIFNESSENISNQKYLAGIKLNTEFHLIIANASGNSHLARLIEKLLNEMERTLARDPFLCHSKQHVKIIKALKDKDKTAAQKAMEEHLEETKSRLMQVYP
jgi:DNA-binding GntR family transcriptional regulator